jgi:hypothetical protein
MRKQSNDSLRISCALKKIDDDFTWNNERKNRAEEKFIGDINKQSYITKVKNSMKFAVSIGAFIVVLLIGYIFFSQDITTNNELTIRTDYPTENVFDEENQEFKEAKHATSEEVNNEQILQNRKTTIVTQEELAKTIDIRLPNHIPIAEKVMPKFTKIEHPNGYIAGEVRYIESSNLDINFYQSEMIESVEFEINHLKNEIYKHEDIEVIEINNHPAVLLLEGETSYRSSLHIITENFFFTLTTHGLTKEEILEMANSIDLTGL